MRVLTWNCRRALAESPLWAYFRQIDADIALLQEVSAFPPELEALYEIRTAFPRARSGSFQRFSSVLLVKGTIHEPLPLRCSIPWVDAQLRYFGPNLMAFRTKLAGSTVPLSVVGVYSPAWPVAREAYRALDVEDVKLQENPEIWVSDLLVAALREALAPSEPWIVAGDFNACETFDDWKGGPRGNRRWLDRMACLGLTECLRGRAGRLTPTYRRPGAPTAHCQIDHLFVSGELASHLEGCTTGDPAIVFGAQLSDHLPIIATFSWAAEMQSNSAHAANEREPIERP